MQPSPFANWAYILMKVVEMLLSNVTTAFAFGALAVSILVSVIASLFNKDGSRKDSE